MASQNGTSVNPDIPSSLGSNNPNIPHPASTTRPAYLPSWGSLKSPTGYQIPDLMINEPSSRPFHIIMIGAGAAGIDFIHHALQVLPQLNVTFQVYEKNADVGGTWFENRYPGVACDVPSHNYQFVWKQNPDWTSYYSGAKEIWEYMRRCVDEEDMTRFIRFQTEVDEARWDKKSGRWHIAFKTRDTDGRGWSEFEEECDVLLNGTGFLNAWKWPDVPGLHDFRGKLFHTAKYDETVDLTGKRVAVLGSGSSGVQTVASIYPKVEKMYHWVRSPTWITAGFAQGFAGPEGKNFNYTQEQKEEWRQNPMKHKQYAKMVENELNQRFKFVLRDTQESDEAAQYAYGEMRRKLNGNESLMDTIIPKTFNVGCRRPTPGNGYLECLVGSKMTCYTSALQKITPTGFIDHEGNEVPVDVIITATGFDTSFRPKFPIIGLDDKSIAEKWKNFPMSYASIAVPSVPNYFMYSGPFTPVAQGSLLPLLTLLTKHILQIITKMRQEHIHFLHPKLRPTLDFAEHAQLYLRRTAWSDPCTSWFKGGTHDGPVVMWPGSRLAYFEVMKVPRYEDYEIEYLEGNRWAWLGNGFEKGEFEGMDGTFYLDDEWIGDHIRKRKMWLNVEEAGFVEGSVNDGGKSKASSKTNGTIGKNAVEAVNGTIEALKNLVVGGNSTS